VCINTLHKGDSDDDDDNNNIIIIIIIIKVHGIPSAIALLQILV
jgi:hypothetical protein